MMRPLRHPASSANLAANPAAAAKGACTVNPALPPTLQAGPGQWPASRLQGFIRVRPRRRRLPPLLPGRCEGNGEGDGKGEGDGDGLGDGDGTGEGGG